MISFKELIQQSLEEVRKKSLIIDYFHAYSYLQHRLDSLKTYAQAVYENDNKDLIDNKEVLKLFADISALAQHCAEELRLILKTEDEDQQSSKINEDLLKVLTNVITHIIKNKEKTKQLQRGKERYKVLFDENEIDTLVDLLNEINE